MRRMRFALSLAFLSVALAGCGRFFDKFSRQGEPGFTHVKFGGSGRVGLTSVLSGGMMIYALGLDTSQEYRAWYFASEAEARNAAAIDLPNGSYRFVAAGYTGAAMSTSTRCGQADSGVVSLSGGSATVTINMSGDGCNDSFFLTDGNFFESSSYGFRNFQIYSCSSTTNIDSFTTSNDCSTAAQKGALNHTRSLKITLVSASKMGGEPTAAEASGGLSSGCIVGGGKPTSSPVTGLTSNSTARSVFALNSSRIFFGSSGQGLYMSTDSGVSFTQITTPAGISSGTINSISGSGSLVYAAANNGLYYSTDSGDTWNSVSGDNFDEVYVNGTVVVAGRADTDGVEFTTATNSFAALYHVTGLTSVNAVYYDSTSSTIYAGGDGYATSDGLIYKSTDGGATWSLLHTATNEYVITKIRKFNGKLYYTSADSGLSGYGRLAVSDDDGATFTKYCNTGCTNAVGGLPNNDMFDIAVSGSQIYVATNNGIGVSADGGSTWTAYSSTELGASTTVFGLAMFNGRVFFAQSQADSYRSTDSKSDGLGFPGGSPSSYPRIPVGGANSGLKAFATKIDIYDDASCSSLSRSVFFPKGLANGVSGESSSFTARLVTSGSTGRLFLKD